MISVNKKLQEDLAHVCRDLVESGSCDLLVLNDIVVTFEKHGYSVYKNNPFRKIDLYEQEAPINTEG